LPIAEAGRLLMAGELATIQTHWPDLRLSAEVTAVHETRKAIRRTFTLFKLFTPYFNPGELERHWTALRRIMRRLAPCRDAAVFQMRLATYNETAERPLHELAACWNKRQIKDDDRLRAYLGRKKVTRRLDRYARLAVTEGMGVPLDCDRTTPFQLRHILLAILLQRVGAVRAWGEMLPVATPAQFHRLRIQFKELRYTLTFFEGVLGPCGEIINQSRRIQECLGDLNDASVAVDLLGKMKQCREEAIIYRGIQQAQVERLMAEFLPVYAAFDRPEWRRDLALAVLDL
jgi:CHAD domain-containing protein